MHQLDVFQDTSNRNPIFLSFSLAAEQKQKEMSQLQRGRWQLSFPSFPVLVLPTSEVPDEPSATETGVARQCSAPGRQAEQVIHQVIHYACPP